ncbi:MAG: hypothetical protein H6872_15225, partial [Methylobacteriaceae bacterium]|nr:hypothetical protein [Methylobacteriaceae bacterium]
MTFDAWIAKMLDALKDESGGKPEARRKKQRNTNPVMIREVAADGHPQRPPLRFVEPPRLGPAPIPPPAPAPPQTFIPPGPLVAMGASLDMAMARVDKATAKASKSVEKAGRLSPRPGLVAKTATGDIRFARSSAAELERRKEDLRRLEAERRAQDEADAAARVERQSRKPGWVRFTRTPDRKPKNPAEAAAETSAEIVAILPAEAPLQAVAQAADAVAQQGLATVATAPAIEPLAAQPVEIAHATPRPLIEILIPRSPEMARTEFFLGDAAQRVVIEEFDAPDLRRAPPMPRIHPRETPEPRNELQRLAALLVFGASNDIDDDDDEDVRVAQLREVPKAPAPEVREQKRRVRVKAGTQAAPVAPQTVIASPTEVDSSRLRLEAKQSRGR